MSSCPSAWPFILESFPPNQTTTHPEENVSLLNQGNASKKLSPGTPTEISLKDNNNEPTSK